MSKQTSLYWQNISGAQVLSSYDFAKGQLCGTQEAARYLGVSVGTVHNLVDRGVLYAIRTGGGHRRIPKDSLLAYQTRKDEGGGGLGSISWVLISTSESTRCELAQITVDFSKLIRLTVYPSLEVALLAFRELQPSVIFVESPSDEQEAKECASIAMHAYNSDVLWVLLSQESSHAGVRHRAVGTRVLMVLSRCVMEAWVRGYLSACSQMSSINRDILTA